MNKNVSTVNNKNFFFIISFYLFDGAKIGKIVNIPKHINH